MYTYDAWKNEEYREFIQVLIRAPFKWILSESDLDFYAPLTRRFGPPLEKIVRWHSSPPVDGKRRFYRELFWANYDIRERLFQGGWFMDVHRLKVIESLREEIAQMCIRDRVILLE